MSSVLPPVLPCAAFNQSSCLLQTCGYSHLPDSFSLGSGGRNVCLLHLISRCDGWGCTYSHSREELAWTDAEIQSLIHSHLRLIDAYNGRLTRNVYSFYSIVPQIAQITPWIPAPQAYPTPSSSVTIDPTINEQHEFNNNRIMSTDSWSPNGFPMNEKDESSSLSVVVETASDPIHRGRVNRVETSPGDCNTVSPQAISLNPLAVPFVPLDCEQAPTGELHVADPALHTTPPPLRDIDSAELNWNSTSDSIAKALETPGLRREISRGEKSATVQEINSWGREGGPTSWDEHPVDDWGTASNGGRGWEDEALGTPSRNVMSPASVPPKEGREPFKGKGQARASRKEEKRASWKVESLEQVQASSKAQRWPTPSSKLEKPLSKKQERSLSAPSKSQTKNGKPRYIVTIPHPDTETTAGSRGEARPHKTPKVEDEERAKSYKIALRPGSIIPEPKVEAEIVKAHLQLARNKASPSHPVPPPIEEIDPGINWVNSGSSRISTTTDPPREFSQRSHAPGSTWGKKDQVAKSTEGDDGGSN